MNCDNNYLNLKTGDTLSINPTSIRTNTSSDHLDGEYITCISSGPSCDELNNEFSLKNDKKSEIYSENNEKPIEYICRASVSCKNIGRVSSGKLKSSTSLPTSALQASYWSKLKRSRRESMERIQKFKQYKGEIHSNFTNSSKFRQRNKLRDGISSNGKITINNEKIKLLNNKNNMKNIINDDNNLKSNKYGITMTNVNVPAEKIEIYYFDHGTAGYYLTTDIAPILISDKCADKIDNVATKFWAEIFGTINIGMTFITAFILQLLRFILRSIIRSLIVGIIQMIADYAFKPFLTILYNGIIQPVLIFLYNIATSIRDLCQPIAQAIGYFLREFINLLRAIRLIEINPHSITNNHHSTNEPI